MMLSSTSLRRYFSSRLVIEIHINAAHNLFERRGAPRNSVMVANSMYTPVLTLRSQLRSRRLALMQDCFGRFNVQNFAKDYPMKYHFPKRYMYYLQFVENGAPEGLRTTDCQEPNASGKSLRPRTIGYSYLGEFVFLIFVYRI